MEVNTKNGAFLNKMIEKWEEQQLIDFSTAQKLKNSYQPKSFDWQKLAQYAFWIAIACGIIGINALFVDKTILEYLKLIYKTPDLVISIVAAFFAAWLYLISFKRISTKPKQILSNHSITIGAAVLTAYSIIYLGKTFGNESNHFSLIILFAALVYGVLAWLFKSTLITAFTLLSLGIWFGAETHYLSNPSYLFLGLNFPARFTLFGLLIILLSLILKNQQKLKIFSKITYLFGLIYFFISIWLLSIFGNYDSFLQWNKVQQLSLFMFALISMIACCLAIFIGLKYQDKAVREIGIIFLFINLYTRFFEYFWDSMHKSIFFLILALSFWLLGRKAEKIWNLSIFK